MTGIDGLKISGKLCLVRLRGESPDGGLLPAFCSLLADRRINTPFLSAESRAGGIQAVCCVDAAHHTLLERLLRTEPVLQARAEFTAGVGLLTLFPHRSHLTSFSRSLRALAQARLRVLAVASSIGALTYVLDYTRLDKAAGVMQACFQLAGNHAPFESESTVGRGIMSGEPQIKTYGFRVVKNLALYKHRLAADLSADGTRAIRRIEEGPNRFHLLYAQPSDSAELDLRLFCAPAQDVPRVRRRAAGIPAAGAPLPVTAPVELIAFQGPHYGDRFGIADFTCKALEAKSGMLLAAVFACSSIYLILPEGAADGSRSRLAAAFRIPG